MALFSDLPVDLLPLILEQILKASHLAQICLVNKTFYDFAVSQLYARIIIRHWYRDVKTKVRPVDVPSSKNAMRAAGHLSVQDACGT